MADPRFAPFRDCDPDKVQTLTTALRSGKYNQGAGRLRFSEDCFCFLGVAVELFDPQRWDTIEDADIAALGGNYEDYWPLLGREQPDGEGTYELTAANDSYELTFAQFADKIEEALRDA